jgi:uncharacterized protein (DUF1778 family)
MPDYHQCHFKAYVQEPLMPHTIVKGNSRIALRVSADDKATLMRAVALQHTDMTDFILRHALDAARKVIAEAEQVVLSERDSIRVLEALEDPPPPNDKLIAAARRLPPLG